MPDGEGDTERTASVAGCGLNPYVIERSLTKYTTVGNAVQGDAASEAEIPQVGLPMREANDFQHNLFSDVLD